jgi:NADPH2:quinone reductase
VVEVAPVANNALNQAVLANGGTVAIYATEGSDDLALPVFPNMIRNVRYEFVLVYTVPTAAKNAAVVDVSAAVAASAIRVGADAGLPLHRFDFADTAAAHAAVESAAVGKVLIDIT